MTELADFDGNAVWVSGSTWRGNQTVLHTDTDCLHLDEKDARGPLDPEVFHDDTPICQRCDPTEPDRFGGSGTSLAHRLRNGDLQDASLNSAAGGEGE